MKFNEMFNQLKAGSECLVKGAGVITYDIQAAALGRAFGTERCNDDVAAGFDRLRDLAHVCGAVSCVHEEVEHRSVVPYVVLLSGKCKRPHVAAKPVDVVGFITKAFSGHGQRGGGNIQNRHFVIPTGQQVVD